MKRSIYLLFTVTLLSLFVLHIQAQTFSLSKKSILLTGANGDDKSATTFITNNGDDSMFTWKVVEFDMLSQWDLSLCDPFYCNADAQLNSSNTFKVKKGVTAPYIMQLFFNGQAGAGCAKVMISNANNASDNDTVVICGNGWVTAVKEVAKSKALTFFPNPAKEQLTIKFPVKDVVNVEIYNILGTRVKSFKHDGSVTQINISDLQNGVYFVRFTDNGKLYTKQFTKAE